MTRTDVSQERGTTQLRLARSRGLVTVLVALAALALLGYATAPSSMNHGAIVGMLPFAAVLAIAGLGQTLVVMQGGIDLSVAGTISLVIVIITHQAYGNDAKVLPAALTALVAAILAGVLNGLLIGRLGLNSIVATLGTNALLYAGVFEVSGGTPRQTTDRMAHIAGGTSFGIPNAVYFAVVAVVLTTIIVKRTVAGRRFEAVGANPFAAWATGLKVDRYRGSAYVGAAVLYWAAGALLAGIINKPTAYQGDTYMLASVAAVVIGGTSLLGGRGNLGATALAALFLTQLQQYVLALGVTFAVQTLVQAAALTFGVALYTIRWKRRRPRRGPSRVTAPSCPHAVLANHSSTNDLLPRSVRGTIPIYFRWKGTIHVQDLDRGPPGGSHGGRDPAGQRLQQFRRRWQIELGRRNLDLAARDGCIECRLGGRIRYDRIW
jgi:ribose transport system permease protein